MFPRSEGGCVKPWTGLVDHGDSNKLGVVIAFASKDFLGSVSVAHRLAPWWMITELPPWDTPGWGGYAGPLHHQSLQSIWSKKQSFCWRTRASWIVQIWVHQLKFMCHSEPRIFCLLIGIVSFVLCGWKTAKAADIMLDTCMCLRNVCFSS